MGSSKFLEILDERLHRIYKSWRPCGFRIPASPTFFSHPFSTPNYEWKAILQVLPFIVQGLCTVRGRDVLVEWAVAFGDWVFATIWPEEHDDVTLERSDEKLWVLEQKCAAIVKKADKDWCFRKMHELVLFVPHIRRSGLVRWFSTDRGERQHMYVKYWWRLTNGKDVQLSLSHWLVAANLFKKLRSICADSNS